MFTIDDKIVHRHWYEDGVEDGPERGKLENLWRCDFDHEHQVQLFAVLTKGSARLILHGGGWEENQYESFALFIERDVREEGGQKRVHYAFLPRWPITADEARKLLAMSNEQVKEHLAEKIKEVDSLPNEPSYCD